MPPNKHASNKLARRRAKAKLGWFIHAAIYVVVNLGLIALSLANGRSWAIFPLLGWGVGLLAHGLSVWLLPPGGALLGTHGRARARQAAAGTKGDPW